MSARLNDEKRALRAIIREDRRALSPREREQAGALLADRLLALTAGLGASSFSCFMSLPSEPDTREFLARAGAAGLAALLPVSREDGLLDWVRVRGDEDHSRALPFTSPGAFGIDEPHGERLRPEAVGEVDVMLIPAAAVDLSGQRLGWGRGYFDRTLATLRPGTGIGTGIGTSTGPASGTTPSAAGPPAKRPLVFAVVFDHEVLDRVPAEPHDVPVDGVVTPTRVIRFPAAAQ